MIRVGTDEDRLARARGEWVLDEIRRCRPSVDSERVELELVASGDHPHLLVHSLVRPPAALDPPPNLDAILVRREPSISWISADHADPVDLPAGAVVCAPSVLYRAQLLHLAPRLHCCDWSGDLADAVEDYGRSGASALLLPRADLEWLGCLDLERTAFTVTELTPAAGEGTLGLEVRSDLPGLHELLSSVNHRDTRIAVAAEQRLLELLGGGELVPVGACARVSGDHLTLTGTLADSSGERRLQLTVEADSASPEQAAEILNDRLRRAGGREILGG